MIKCWFSKLFFQGCILVFNIPSSCQSQGPSRIVCVNPSALLNCIAGVLCETDPREFVPQFVKAGKVERFWPTGARPNEWTLRAAIGDIVNNGFVRESVVPLCFQVRVPLDLQVVVVTMLSVASVVYSLQASSLLGQLQEDWGNPRPPAADVKESLLAGCVVCIFCCLFASNHPVMMVILCILVFM